MFFNSIDFAIFLPIVFFAYWFVPGSNVKRQNIIIVVASYIFYGWWDWRFLFLILLSTIVDYIIGKTLPKHTKRQTRKLLLYTSIFVNIGLLFFFKYFNFFVESFEKAYSLFGSPIHLGTLKIILPVGISFYTFQTLSYTIDVYKQKLEPTSNVISFMSFVSFFPQLVAGPIERASNLLPQFYTIRRFDYIKAVDGMRQILWGLFKKVVIADNCAEYANMIFDNSQDYSGSSLFLGAVLFAFQIYGDFSGYSDIAIGSARLFGFDLKRNFAFPYFSRDIAEFWRRWHISLSTWFRDYVYIPLGGSRVSRIKVIRNTFIVFVVSGFWHGANLTYIAWGFIHALYFMPLLLLNKNRKNVSIVAQESFLPTLREAIQIGVTFFLTVIAWVFFRADTVSQAIHFLEHMFSYSLFSMPTIPYRTIALTAIFVIIEWVGRKNEYAIENMALMQNKTLRWGLYITITLIILLFPGKEQEFIYFQF